MQMRKSDSSWMAAVRLPGSRMPSVELVLLCGALTAERLSDTRHGLLCRLLRCAGL